MSIKTINKKCHTNVDCENGLGYATFRVAMGDEIADNWQRFGKWVLTHREATGMRQEDLASLIGSDRQTIYRIEKGNSTKRQTIAKIAEALSQPVETALAIAFGVEVNDNPIESALLDALKRLPKEKQQDVLTMVGKVRPEGAWLKVFPEGRPPFRVRSELARLFAIAEPSRPPDCCYECDLTGRTLDTSASLNRLFGLSACEMEGEGWLNAINGTELERLETAAIWQSAIETRSLYRSAYTVQHQESGLLIPCRTLATLAMRGGRPVYRGIVFPC